MEEYHGKVSYTLTLLLLLPKHPLMATGGDSLLARGSDCQWLSVLAL